MTKTALTLGVAALSLIATTPAAAAEYLFDGNGDAYTLSFDGSGGDPVATIPGLTSGLQLSLLSGIGSKTLTFSYTLTKTSNTGGSEARVSGFAFDSSPNANGGSTSGEFSTLITSGGNYPNGIGGVEVCLTSSNACAGGGGGAAGAYFGDPATGTFTLNYAANTSAVTLSDFHVRYQGLAGRVGSATGNEVTGAVPEPSTWAMMLIGFGAVGFGLRRRKDEGKKARVRVACA